MKRFPALLLSVLLLLPLCNALADTDAPAPATTPAATAPATGAPAAPKELDADTLFDLGKTLFDNYAPDEIKRDYEFPSRAQFDAFVPRLQLALEGNSLQDLASFEKEARQTLFLLKQYEGTELLQAWLEDRLELIEAARDLSKPAPKPGLSKPTRPQGKPGDGTVTTKPTPGAQGPTSAVPTLPGTELATTGGADIPNYDYWLARLKDRPAPAGARELMPMLSSCFVDEKSPAALAWLAEVESTFNSSARSPAGAAGLYQLMPATAQGLGLSTWMPDDRTHPEKSARAAARLLRSLYVKFGDWPLALAAYNAGEGRIRRLLAKQKSTTFAGIADALPVETRLYVPRVLATVATRTGISPDKL